MIRRAVTVRALGLALLLAAGAAQATTITVTSTDSAGEGFNDPTAWTPVGGNPATTVGQARLNVFDKAAAIWTLRIATNVPITVSASFDPLACDATSATLGRAGSGYFYTVSGHPGNILFPKALANKLTGSDVHAGLPDITAKFSSSLDGSSGCLGGETFYYGFDHNPGASQIDLLAVVLHELGHGLGFISLVDSDGNGYVSGSSTYFSVFDQYIYDESTASYWPTMTTAQRKTSTTNNGAVVWNDANGAQYVNDNVSSFLSLGVTAGGHVRLYAPTTWSDGSSISHWDTTTTTPRPHLLMEHTYHTGVGTSVDLTTCVLYDLGWTGTHCPDRANSAPVAMNESVGTPMDTAVAVTLAATDADGDALTYGLVDAPSHGIVTGSGTARTYTPTTGYTGADSFTYQASDGIDASAVATVSITVSAAGSSSSSSSSGGSSSGGASSGGSASSSGSSSASKSSGGGATGPGLLLLLALMAAMTVRGRRRRTD
ncbi:MAG TPA: Ig-like domain-containing protein [Steroidobacteraceae bacterium]|nr:Ig-like domain-containing protein [Steroidobacteraceae bacterium]